MSPPFHLPFFGSFCVLHGFPLFAVQVFDIVTAGLNNPGAEQLVFFIDSGDADNLCEYSVNDLAGVSVGLGNWF